MSAADIRLDSGLPERNQVCAGGSRLVPVAEGYEQWAPVYDDTPNPLLAREERYLLPMLSDLHNKSILDSACGTGRWLERLIALGGGYGVGIDSSMAMLRVAGMKTATSGRLVRASLENLPFSKAAFDIAICSFAIGHISDLNAMARELTRVTRPDADVFVSDLHPEAYARGWRVGFRLGNIAVQIETQYRSAGDIIDAFCSNGFQCRANEALWLGEPEKPFFVRAGKGDFFRQACRMPAVLICHFRRLDSR
jgi:ubiquinone/menaquinone biosynthesis C-methylase UbiE